MAMTLFCDIYPLCNSVDSSTESLIFHLTIYFQLRPIKLDGDRGTMGQWDFLGNPQWENPENTVTWPQRYSSGHIVFLVCGMQYFECKIFYTYERSRWNMGHIGTKDHGVQCDNWGTLGQVSLCAPQCPNVPQCSVLQYNCDRPSPPKTAVWIILGK